eukprot:CAMPEP_0113507378 /NCGR_PEP_ID=MMETSP0014_2-20120614/36430_1 /TAXON_ID=2857 /ORGANISM="Nitzschia sp." /LENGTH=365 /DNA_ID=CAMNT_0000402977 /DNA_START=173 /DNA_END=1270 /DNA_ORIENTATION=+ /assembly_acc=CAM_ASM_000159
MTDEVEYWIYHEKQVALLCGQHALNNLVQANVFSPEKLARIAYRLDQLELDVMAQNNEGGRNSQEYLQRVAEGSGNVDPSGNFSIEVLRAAIQAEYNLDLPNVRQDGALAAVGDVTNCDGFICHKDAHWFAIRMINGRFWNLNSMADRPTTISHFNLATEIAGFQKSGYTVFCVPVGLPPPCTSKAQRQRGLPEFWWKERDLVAGKTNAITGATDPWRNTGSGMRLDGQSTSTSSSANHNIEGLTEEEMLQMALAASMDPSASAAAGTRATQVVESVELTAEPPAGTAGSTRIQLRMPDGKRVVRRFMETDPVGMIYAFVENESNGNGKSLDMKVGFPPKPLSDVRSKTIAEAGLAGEAVQCRYV